MEILVAFECFYLKTLGLKNICFGFFYSGQVKSSWDISNQVMTGQVKFGLVKSDRSSQRILKILKMGHFRLWRVVKIKPRQIER